MNNKALTMALLMSLLAVFFVESYIESVEEGAKKEFGARVFVVRAKVDIKENETVNEGMLSLDIMPKKFAEPSAVQFAKKADDPDTVKSLRALVGTVALIPIRAGEQITYNKITEPGVRTGLAPQVTPGRRAISVPVNDMSSVSRLVKPGDRVDVIATIDLGGQKTNKVTKTILQDVLVLAVGKYVTNNVARLTEMEGNKEKVRNLNEDTNYASVTIEVEPTQAMLVMAALANNESGVFLSLRNSDDQSREVTPMVGVNELLGVEGRTPRAPAQAGKGDR
ncbi:MAG: Flp pilus assembly protein CpaB [Bdellovibrionales bacterium]|nr:Flp pilus assembly protein CpaB [Bdellovibrionales bacterium]